MKDKGEALSPMKHKGEDIESYKNIKQRMLSPAKLKAKNIESYENMPIGTSTQGLNRIRKQEVDSLKGPLIPNSKARTLDFGNWHIKRNLCTYSLIWSMRYGMQMHANFILKCSKCRLCI